MSSEVPLGLQGIASRHSTHSFDSSKPVPKDVLLDILEGSRSLPTSANTQPWTMIVVQGDKRNQLSSKLLEKFEAGDAGQVQYELLPVEMIERMKKPVDADQQFHQEHFGAEQSEMKRDSFEFGGAPIHILICAPHHQSITEGVNGILLDIGTLVTAIVLGAHGQGFGAKPQLTCAQYKDLCQEVLGKEQLPDDLLIVGGISIGYPKDGRDPLTQPDLFPARLSVDETARWINCDATWLSAAEGAAGSGGEQNLLRLIQSRHCSHSLDTSKPISKDIIYAILEAARNVPSAKNSQPWSATVIQGEARDKLSAQMLEDFDAGKDGGQTYKKYSAQNTAQMQKGKDQYGYELYEVKHGLERGDTVGRRQKYRPNYEFWGGPVLLLLTLPKNAVAGTFVDIGSFMYAILLGMHSYGLGGKPLGSTAKYTDLCRTMLGSEAMPEDEHLICGLTMGWPKGGDGEPRDPRVTPDFFPSRLPLSETTRWVGDEAWMA